MSSVSLLLKYVNIEVCFTFHNRIYCTLNMMETSKKQEISIKLGDIYIFTHKIYKLWCMIIELNFLVYDFS